MTNLDMLLQKNKDRILDKAVYYISGLGYTCGAPGRIEGDCGPCDFNGVCKESTDKIREWLKERYGMKRLIDADALKVELGDRRLDHDFCIYGDEATVRDFIDDAPTIEAEPVRHGKWIPVGEPDDNDNVHAQCSVCGHGDTYSKGLKVPYCWFCGAKMDED